MQNKEGKRAKGVLKGMGEYEARVKRGLAELEIKVNGLECELKIIREHERSEGKKAVMQRWRVQGRWMKWSSL
jgi:hypothetical protein